MQTVQGHALAETGPKRDACHSGGMVRGGRRAAHRQQMCALLVAAVAISIDPTTRSQPAAAFQPNIRHNRRRSGRSGSGGRMHAPRTRTVAALVPTCYHVCCQRLIAAHGTGALEAPGRHQPRSKPEVGHAVAGHDGVCSGDGTGAVGAAGRRRLRFFFASTCGRNVRPMCPRHHSCVCVAVAMERAQWERPVDGGAISERGKLEAAKSQVSLYIDVNADDGNVNVNINVNFNEIVSSALQRSWLRWCGERSLQVLNLGLLSWRRCRRSWPPCARAAPWRTSCPTPSCWRRAR